jgi:hypothetical protein
MQCPRGDCGGLAFEMRLKPRGRKIVCGRCRHVWLYNAG